MRPRNNGLPAPDPQYAFLLGCLILFSPVFFGAARPWIFLSLTAAVFALLVVQPGFAAGARKLPRFWVWGWAILLGWISLQWIFVAADRHAAGYQLLLWYAAALFVMTLQALKRRQVFGLLGLLAVLGFLESLYGLYVVASGREYVLWLPKGPHEGYVTGTYFNRNHLAGLLEMAIAAQLAFILRAFQEEKLKKILVLMFLLIITVMGFVKTGSRSGMVSLVLALTVCLPVLFGNRRRVPLSFVVFVVVTGLLLLQASWHVIAPRFMEFYEQAETWDGRLIAWQGTVQLIRDHPGTGVGLGNFIWSFAQHRSPDLLLVWEHAHADYLELAAELGLPAAVLAAGLMAGAWIAAIFRLRRLPASVFPFAWGCLVGVSAVSIHGLTDFNFAIPANLLIYFMLWGLLFRLLYPAGARKKGADHREA